MKNRIEVGMGRGVVTRSPHVISSLGLGSCVVVTLYDTKRKMGGLAHVMLPDSKNLNGCQPPYQYADTAIATLIKELRTRRAIPRDMVAKLVGGAKMFSSIDDFSPGIGEQNIASVKCILKQKLIPVTGENTGGDYGRSVEFYLDTGRVVVRAIGKEAEEI